VTAEDRIWMRDALCAEPSYQALPWIPERGVSPAAVREAKAVCARCLVRSECLSCADDLDLPGIWGGTTTKERRRARREAAG
jgi:WhiB family redox-sensing transcriptional regulator